jgi:hypothetical protein
LKECSTEEAISEKLGLAVDNPVRAPFFEFADDQLAIDENQGHFWNPWCSQLSNDAKISSQLDNFFSIVASTVYGLNFEITSVQA